MKKPLPVQMAAFSRGTDSVVCPVVSALSPELLIGMFVNFTHKLYNFIVKNPVKLKNM